MPSNPNAPSQRDSEQRRRPADMPTQAPPPQKDSMLKGTEKPRDVLPQQKPITDEETEIRKPAKWKTVLTRVFAILLLVLALALMYVFLLLGEPDEVESDIQQVTEEKIRMPMTAVESPGESNVASLAQTFGKPVLSLYGSGLNMQLSRIYDTAFGGGYARRVTLTYAFEDGARLLLESIRPTDAVTLLRGSDYVLDADTLYAIGGVDAARMDSEQQICVFGQTGEAVYAVICPKTHEEQLGDLLKQTALISGQSEQ